MQTQLRSTSGCQVNLRGKNARFPLVGNSKRQSCVSRSIPEVEIVAAETTLRNHGLYVLCSGRGRFDIDPMSYCRMIISP